MRRSGRRAGCRFSRSWTRGPPAGTRGVTDHIDLLLLLLLRVLPFGPRVCLPFFGHQATGHGAIGPQVETFEFSKQSTRTSVDLGLQLPLPDILAPTTPARRREMKSAEGEESLDWTVIGKKEDRTGEDRYSTTLKQRTQQTKLNNPS